MMSQLKTSCILGWSSMLVWLSHFVRCWNGWQSPILPLRLLVPASYPKCSPVLLDKFPDEQWCVYWHINVYMLSASANKTSRWCFVAAAGTQTTCLPRPRQSSAYCSGV
jgi:hypothetical protein